MTDGDPWAYDPAVNETQTAPNLFIDSDDLLTVIIAARSYADGLSKSVQRAHGPAVVCVLAHVDEIEATAERLYAAYLQMPARLEWVPRRARE